MNSIARYGMKYNNGKYCMWSIDTHAWCGDRVRFINVFISIIRCGCKE